MRKLTLLGVFLIFVCFDPILVASEIVRQAEEIEATPKHILLGPTFNPGCLQGYAWIGGRCRKMIRATQKTSCKRGYNIRRGYCLRSRSRRITRRKCARGYKFAGRRCTKATPLKNVMV